MTDGDCVAPTNTLEWYLRRIGQAELLSGGQERALLGRVAAGRRAAAALDELAAIGVLPRCDLAGTASDGHAAEAQLVAANLRLVVSVAKHHAGGSKLELLDLIQEGNLGLLRALETFDVSRNVRFATYATWWIRQCVLRAVANKGRTVRLPVYIQRHARDLERLRDEVTQERGGIPPSVAELAGRLRVGSDRVQQLMAAARLQPISLDQPVTSDGDDALRDLVEDRGAPNPEDTVVNAQLGHAALAALQRLAPPERRVLRLRFGLDDGRPRTLSEIGAMLTLSGERVRQVEARGLEELRSRLNPLDVEAAGAV